MLGKNTEKSRGETEDKAEEPQTVHPPCRSGDLEHGRGTGIRGYEGRYDLEVSELGGDLGWELNGELAVVWLEQQVGCRALQLLSIVRIVRACLPVGTITLPSHI